MYSLDTNTFIDYAGKKLPAKSSTRISDILNSGQVICSVIVWIEVLGFQKITDPEFEFFERLLGRTKLIELTPEIQQATISLRRKHSMKLGDAIIAATA